MIWSREEIAWAAGFFEEEGTFASRQRDFLPAMRVKNTDMTMLQQFLAYVKLGTIHGPYPYPGSKWKPVGAWHTGGFESVQALVAAMWPWLSLRRRARATEVLNAYRLRKRRRRPRPFIPAVPTG